MATSSTVDGKVHYNPEPTKQFTRDKISEFWDKREANTRELCKRASILSAPLLINGIAFLLRFIPFVPESVRVWVNYNGTRIVTENCDPVADACAKSVHQCSKRISHKSSDVSLDLYAKFRNWTASWIK